MSIRRLNVLYIIWVLILVLLAVHKIAFGEMAMIHSFSSGEITEQLGGRADVKKWYSACQTMENFYCQSTGGAGKRPGTYYIAEAADSDTETRIISFEKSNEESLILELSDETMQFYR